jgi:hypothetical protein
MFHQKISFFGKGGCGSHFKCRLVDYTKFEQMRPGASDEHHNPYGFESLLQASLHRNLHYLYYLIAAI